MITTNDFRKRCGCRSVGECTHNMFVEIHALDAMVNAFAKAMKEKLKQKYIEGYHGWDRLEEFPTTELQQKLKEHCDKGDPVDVANFAAMLWNREQP